MRGVARVLATAAVLRRVVLGYALFAFVEMGVWLALILWAYSRGGPGWAATVSVVQMVPAALLAPTLAAVADHIPRGTALRLAHAGVAGSCALVALCLVLDAPDGVVVAAGVLVTTTMAMVRPAHFAALPRLATAPEDLVAANAVSSAAEGLTRLLGSAAAGASVAVWGAGAVAAAGAGFAGLAVALCVRLGIDTAPAPTGGEADTGAARTSPLREATQGLRVLTRDRAAAALIGVMTTQYVLSGALDVLGAALARGPLGLGDPAAGLIVGATGVGSVVGAGVASWTARRSRLAPVVVAGCVLQGLAFALIGLGDHLAVAVLASAVVGLGTAVTVVCGRTLLQRATDDHVLARVFAAQESTLLLGWSLGAALAPGAIGALGAALAFVPIGILTVVLAVLGRRPLRRLDSRAVDRTREIALLRAIPFLAELSPYELERLAQAARWVSEPEGCVVVRQGEPGTDWFVVAQGRLAVDVNGVRREHVLGPGDSFGEIALLYAVPRTATVTALEPVQLLALGAPDFLAAVTHTADGHAVAAEVALAHISRDLASRE